MAAPACSLAAVNRWIPSPPTPVRESEYYLSLDIDLTRIQTRHRALRIFLDAFGFVKVPTPGLRFSPSDGLRVCAICG